MPRISPVEVAEAGWFVRLVYWFTKRKLGRVVMPVKITAHHPRLLRAYGEMETGQAAAHSVEAALKLLSEIKAATMIGCPF